jgi:phospholipase C
VKGAAISVGTQTETHVMGFIRKIIDWIRGTSKDPLNGPIKHVVLLMFENHSFDQMLGCMKSVFPALDGVDPAHPRSNQDSTGREYFQEPSAKLVVDPDPKHELEHILNQIKDDNSGFVSEYENEFPDTTPEQRQQIMSYFQLGDLPVFDKWSAEFTCPMKASPLAG